MSEWVAAGAAVASLIAGVTTGAIDYTAQKHTMAEQKAAQEKAERTQKEADDRAEKQRLEALAANQQATDYGNIWGADSAKFTDAAQKLSAGTGSFDTEDDETNPFYYRGLL